jgi:hypothetical protein
MRSRWFLNLLTLAPLVLGGCLLPQPDTPPVPPSPAKAARPGIPVGGTPLLPQPDTPPIGKAEGAVTSGNSGSLIQPDTPPVVPGMLPQPDTPPVTAIGDNAAMDGTKMAAGGAAGDPRVGTSQTTAENGMTLAHPTAPIAMGSSAPALPGKLSGTFTGQRVVTVQLEDESGETVFQREPVGSDGLFSFELQPGRYYVEVTLDSGKHLRLAQAFEVTSEAEHTYTITLRESPPSATVAEEVPLTEASTAPQ